MEHGGSIRAERFALVKAGHSFLLKVLPFREPASRAALHAFAQQIAASRLPAADVETVLLRCLMVLNAYTGGRLPTLVDRFLADEMAIESPTCASIATRFTRCIEELLTYQGVGSFLVQQAIAMMQASYMDAGLTQERIAARLGVRPSWLSVSFKVQTGMTPSAYLRALRLDRAANQLMTTNRSIKEVWVSVGYNQASSFGHNFRERFGMSAREYRARCVLSGNRSTNGSTGAAPAKNPGGKRDRGRGRVMIVDGDPEASGIVCEWLLQQGFTARNVNSGESCLREIDEFAADVLLLDYQLPDMDTLACLRSLRKRSRGMAARVALLTADWWASEVADQLLALDAIIAWKPCGVQDVERLVTYLLESRPTA